jgi:hypothetical protein
MKKENKPLNSLARGFWILHYGLKWGIVLIAIFLPFWGKSQGSVPEQISQNFDSWRQNNLQEKLFLHSDKDYYLAGEICWFKIYDVDGYFHKPLDFSKVAYIEVLDRDNKPLIQSKIGLKNGHGNGSLFLPVNLGTGIYKIRAYTNWMKNFGPDYYFEKQLTILNPRKVSKSDTVQPKDQYEVAFFPEGGNLVSGLESEVGFRVVNQSGHGMECSGFLVGDLQDTVVRFKSLNFGMGHFSFTPIEGRTYRAVISLGNGKILEQPVPAAYKEGFVMHVEGLEGNRLKVEVRKRGGETLGKEVYLFAHTRGVIKSALTGNLLDGKVEFLLDNNSLGEGISQLTLFNSDKQPVCERLYFKFPGPGLNLEVIPDSKEFETRRKITLHLSDSGKNGAIPQNDLSMAVFRVDSLQSVEDLNIFNYLWLTSDLAGAVESAGYYFDQDGKDRSEAMDNLMLTQGWRRFKWGEILQNKKPVFEFLPEYAGHLVRARIVKSASGLPAPEIGVYLSVPGTRTQFRPGISDQNGSVKFEMRDFYNQGEIIVQTNTEIDSSYSIEVLTPFAQNYSTKRLPVISFAKIPLSDLRAHNLGVQVQNTYYGDKVRQFSSPSIDTTAFYYKPDFSYLLDNYVRFTTLEEVFREYVSPVIVRSSKGKYHLPILDQLEKQYFQSDPLVLLDGVPIFNINKVLEYDPLKIRKLDVMSRMYYFGDMYFSGIINFVTYKGDLGGLEIDPRATVLDYEGLQLQREFYSPVYSTEQQVSSRTPDFRNLLIWAPEIHVGQTGRQDISFYSSDLPGNYAAVLQGLSKDGVPGVKIINFTVSDSPAKPRKEQ